MRNTWFYRFFATTHRDFFQGFGGFVQIAVYAIGGVIVVWNSAVWAFAWMASIPLPRLALVKPTLYGLGVAIAAVVVGQALGSMLFYYRMRRRQAPAPVAPPLPRQPVTTAYFDTGSDEQLRADMDATAEAAEE